MHTEFSAEFEHAQLSPQITAGPSSAGPSTGLSSAGPSLVGSSAESVNIRTGRGTAPPAFDDDLHDDAYRPRGMWWRNHPQYEFCTMRSWYPQPDRSGSNDIRNPLDHHGRAEVVAYWNRGENAYERREFLEAIMHYRRAAVQLPLLYRLAGYRKFVQDVQDQLFNCWCELGDEDEANEEDIILRLFLQPNGTATASQLVFQIC